MLKSIQYLDTTDIVYLFTFSNKYLIILSDSLFISIYSILCGCPCVTIYKYIIVCMKFEGEDSKYVVANIISIFGDIFIILQ